MSNPIAKLMTDMARGPHLMPANPTHEICHDSLEDSVVAPMPTAAELQMRLTTATESVDELTTQVLRLTNENGNLHRELAAAGKKMIQAAKIEAELRLELLAVKQKLADAETALGCERYKRAKEPQDYDALAAENLDLQKRIDLMRQHAAAMTDSVGGLLGDLKAAGQ